MPAMNTINNLSRNLILYLGLFAFLTLSCTEKKEPSPMDDEITGDQAKVVAVDVTGQPNDYTFNVTIESPDTGCDQYADWWEVFTPDSVLIYRRILAHSHVSEQPFTRSGGGINLGADDFCYVRAHMNNLGYGTIVFSGSVSQGLKAAVVEKDFAANLAAVEPLPTDCAF